MLLRTGAGKSLRKLSRILNPVLSLRLTVELSRVLSRKLNSELNPVLKPKLSRNQPAAPMDRNSQGAERAGDAPVNAP